MQISLIWQEMKCKSNFYPKKEIKKGLTLTFNYSLELESNFYPKEKKKKKKG